MARTDCTAEAHHSLRPQPGRQWVHTPCDWRAAVCSCWPAGWLRHLCFTTCQLLLWDASIHIALPHAASTLPGPASWPAVLVWAADPTAPLPAPLRAKVFCVLPFGLQTSSWKDICHLLLLQHCSRVPDPESWTMKRDAAMQAAPLARADVVALCQAALNARQPQCTANHLCLSACCRVLRAEAAAGATLLALRSLEA